MSWGLQDADSEAEIEVSLGGVFGVKTHQGREGQKPGLGCETGPVAA